MKLPAVAITAAFGCGVALGLCSPLARLATSHSWLVTGFPAAVSLIGVGIVLLNRALVGAACAILLPGEAEKEAERKMLSEHSQGELQSEVLKVEHHGGRNSTTSDFLAAVRPHLRIILSERVIRTSIPVRTCWSGSRMLAFAFCGRTAMAQFVS